MNLEAHRLLRTLLSLFLIFGGVAAVAQTEPLGPTGVGFKTVEEAMTVLKDKPGVTVTTRSRDQWIIINEPWLKINWSFAPVGHYAYPAVVRRDIKVNDEGKLVMQTRALCDSGRSACERLIAEFNESNRRAYENLQTLPAPK
jgi:hypothetical protein